MPRVPGRVILMAMFGSRRIAARLALRRPVCGGLCGCLCGVLACGGNAKDAREEVSSDEAPPDESPAGEVLPDTPLVVSPLAGAFAPLIADALAQPEEARPYLRYVLASRGADALESERERLALLRLVNSVSLSPELAAPVVLAELSAYRLDLRDYLWDRAVDVGGVTFSDAWEAIVERSGLALPALAEAPLAALTGTATAVLPARAFLAAASSGAVYYALTGAPGFEMDLQEGLAARFPEPETERVYNPGFGAETRHPYQGARRLVLPDGSAYWQGLPDTSRGNSLYQDPFSFNSWETDAIYPLPNGLPAFFLDTPAYGTTPAPLTQLINRAEDSPDELVADCIACHSSGPLPVEDFLDDFVRNNLIYFDSDTAEYFMNQWPTQEELDAVVAGDRAVYEGVLQTAGLSVEDAGELQAITRRYAGGLDLADMAAALHASEAQVRAALSGGKIPLGAESFRSRFRPLLCQIHPDAGAASDYCR